MNPRMMLTVGGYCWQVVVVGLRGHKYPRADSECMHGFDGQQAYVRSSKSMMQAALTINFYISSAVQFATYSSLQKKNKTKNCVSKCSRAPLSKIIILLQLSLCFFCSMVADLSTFGLGLTRFFVEINPKFAELSKQHFDSTSRR